MKKINILLLALLCAGATWGQNAPIKITIDPPEVLEGSISLVERRNISAALLKAINNIDGYVAVAGSGNADKIDRLTREQVFQNKGLVRDNEKSELGEMAGSGMIATTELIPDNGKIYAEITLVYLDGTHFNNDYDYLRPSPREALDEDCKRLVEKILIQKLGKFKQLPNDGLMVREEDSGEAMLWHTAQEACEKSTAGGYNDWRLPTQAELEILYKNRTNIGGFVNTWYWSSTAKDGGRVELNFENGRNTPNYSYDEITRRCRCVRNLKY